VGHYGEVLDIDFNRLSTEVFEALIRKPGKLSGAEVKFIRNRMGMTQNIFADFLGIDRSSVGKWEAKDLRATGMATATEILLRIQMARHVKRSIDREILHIEPATRRSGVGKMIEIAV